MKFRNLRSEQTNQAIININKIQTVKFEILTFLNKGMPKITINMSLNFELLLLKLFTNWDY